MKICFAFMFWGTLLLALDFKVGAFDFVPNFVGALGYAALAIGTGGLAPMTGNFVAACSLGWLLFFAVIGRPYVPSDVQVSFGGLMTVIDSAMMWTALNGVRDIAVGRGRPQLVERVALLQWAYIAVVIGSWVVSEFVHTPTNVARVLTVVILAAAVAVMVMIMRLLYQGWKRLSP